MTPISHQFRPLLLAIAVCPPNSQRNVDLFSASLAVQRPYHRSPSTTSANIGQGALGAVSPSSDRIVLSVGVSCIPNSDWALLPNSAGSASNLGTTGTTRPKKCSAQHPRSRSARSCPCEDQQTIEKQTQILDQETQHQLARRNMRENHGPLLTLICRGFARLC